MFVRQNKQDLLLEHFLINESDVRGKRELRKLNESEKREITKTMTDSLMKFTLNKAKSNDYELVERSKGDVTKFEGYTNIKECLNLLRTIHSNSQNTILIEEISSIESALRNLENQKTYFTTGYRTNKEIIKALYENVLVACICSTSFLIATSVEYVKDMTGSVKPTASSIRTQKGYPTLFLKNIELYNRRSVSGDINKFFEASLKSNNFTGSGVLAGVGMLVVGTGLVITVLREIVYQYFYLRVYLADYLKLQASFLELNQKNLKSNSNEAKKQQDIANKLLKLADKIDVDQKTSSRRAESDVVKENSGMSLAEPTLDANTSNDIFF